MRACPVTVTVALDRVSLELLPALTSTGPRFHDQVAGDAGVREQADGRSERNGLRCAGCQVDPGDRSVLAVIL